MGEPKPRCWPHDRRTRSPLDVRLDVEEELPRLTPEAPLNLDSVEEELEVLSSFMAEVLKRRTPAKWEGSLEAHHLISASVFQRALTSCSLRHLYYEWSKHVTALQYEIRRENRGCGGAAYVLVPPSPEYEIAIRQAHIFTHLQRSASAYLPFPSENKALTMRDAARALVKASGEGGRFLATGKYGPGCSRSSFEPP